MIGMGDVVGDDGKGALDVLRRGLAASPSLRDGLKTTAALGVSVAVARLVVPTLIQRAMDDGILVDGGPDLGAVWRASLVGAVVVFLAMLGTWWTQRRLVDRAELALAEMRRAGFAKVHDLSMAAQTARPKGVLVARVTSDIEALARFAQWGLFSWTVNPVVILGTLGLLAWYSWVIAVAVALTFAPVVPVLRFLQGRQLRAYDRFRTRVGEMFAAFSETVSGAAVVRADGTESVVAERLESTIDRRYRTRLEANRYMAGIAVLGDLFGAIATVVVIVIGVFFGDDLGLTSGELLACVFLANLLAGPIGELGETLDQTQTAVAGWRKILELLDEPIDLTEPVAPLPGPDAGPASVSVRGLRFAYVDDVDVLRGVEVDISPGENIAIVGETGSGKTTFARLLVRLADPTEGSIEVSGVELSALSSVDRLGLVRLVPQDGFLFDTTIERNVAHGRPGATRSDVLAAFDRLGLDDWLARLPDGIDTNVGDRGGALSVGERQLVALARASLADPGLLILDEATSAVDPETDQALTSALRRLAEGRTLVSIAHRLATAEAADRVLVFDEGELVEVGPHDELVAAGGVYTRLHAAWIGGTRAGGELATESDPSDPTG